MNDSAKLLELARRTLRQQLREDVRTDNKYTMLMIASAMAIVSRQIERGLEEVDEDEMRRLCQDIRAGNIGPGSARYDAIHDMLMGQAQQKVLISNPGYLEK